MQCDWIIAVGETEKILLEFISVNTEKDYDVIQVRLVKIAITSKGNL